MYVYLFMRYILYFNKMGKDKVPHYTSSFMHFQQIEFINTLQNFKYFYEEYILKNTFPHHNRL